MIKIEFEGIDGSSKTTSLKYCLEQLQSKGYKALESREVGNPHIPVCIKLRELVLHPNSGLSGEAMELVFSAMRIENDKWQKGLWKERLETGKQTDFILSDRGYLSHLAYTDHNVSPEFSKALYNNFLFKWTNYPDIVIYFKVDSETALKRRVSRGTSDVIEMKGVKFQEKVRASFETYLDEIPACTRVYTVDANQDLLGVQTQLNKILNDIIMHLTLSNLTNAYENEALPNQL